AILVKLLTEPLPRLSVVAPAVPPVLADIVHAALERDPNRRPSASALHRLLSTFLNHRERRTPSLFSVFEEDTDLHVRMSPDFDDSIALDESDIVDVTEDSDPLMLRHPSPPEMEWFRPRSLPPKPEVEQHMSSAERALGINAMGEA